MLCCCAPSPKRDLTYAYVLFAVSVVIGLATFAVEVYTTVVPDASDDDPSDDDGGNATVAMAFSFAGALLARLR